MRTQHCPNCEFIYIGDDGPGDECPECGSAWSPRSLDELAVLPVAESAAADTRSEKIRPRLSVWLFAGLMAGGIAGLIAGVLCAGRFIPVEDSGEYRELLSRTVRAEEARETALSDARAARADTADHARTLNATQQELQALQAELEVLREFNRATHEELSQVSSRLEDLQAEMLAVRRSASQSYVRDWLLLGPLNSPAGNSSRFPQPAPLRLEEPVRGPAGVVNWRPYSSEENRVNLAQFFDYRQKAVCFAATWVHSDQDRDVVLNLGSDDGICVWINGEKVHEHATNRAASPGQDRAPARLTSGWNEILVAVDNTGSGDWDLYFEFLTAGDSRPLRLFSTNTPHDDSE